MNILVSGMNQNVIQKCKFYFLVLNGSNGVADKSQLINCVQLINKDFHIHKEVL